MTKKEDMSKNKLYIENLPHDFTNDQLNDLFMQFGIIDSTFMNLKKGDGTGFVTYKNQEDAKRALKEADM